MKKTQLVTIFLLIMTFILMGAVFYIASILKSGPSESSSIAPVKTKAQNITYRRTIALNMTTPTPTQVLTPTTILNLTSTEIPTPTPTEIILAYASPSTTITSSVTPTKASVLPETGYITNALIIFAVASFFVFFAFIF